MGSEIIANVIRGETVESVHRGHAIAIDGEGSTLMSIGDPQTVTFLRSAAKPFQAMPLLLSGAADEFGFTEDEIALACASHSGEPMHVETAASMLKKIGLDENYLRCGAHLPFYEPEAERLLRANEPITQLHNNCSGKHAGMLAAAKHMGSDLDRYEEISHPVQQAALKSAADHCGVDVKDIAIGIDGCAAPNFAMPLAAMARGFLSLVNPSNGLDEIKRSAAARVVAAMASHPELIGGSDRLDTVLMKAVAGQIISKVGADGVWLCGIVPSDKYPKGAAIAVKVEDGNDLRARPVLAVHLLRKLGILNDHALPELSPMPIRNRRGDVVGSVIIADGI